jgi:hypothetical protein
MPDSLPYFPYYLDRELSPDDRQNIDAGSGRVGRMLVKTFCILTVLFVGIGMVGISIRRRRGR